LPQFFNSGGVQSGVAVHDGAAVAAGDALFADGFGLAAAKPL
jgi:hypothetical protein